MKPQVREFQSLFLRSDIPAFRPGDTLRVSLRVSEGDKERIQIFEGLVIQIRGESANQSVTLRKISNNVAVERVIPLHSPSVSEIKCVRTGTVRRARLYYLRDLQGKAARIRSKESGLAAVIAPAEAPAAEAVPA